MGRLVTTPEKRREYEQRYRDKHRGELAERRRVARLSMAPEALAREAAYHKQYVATHPDLPRAAHERWFAKHAEQVRARRRERARRWRADHPDQRRMYEQRRRARKREAFVSDADMRELFGRSLGICHLCGVKVDWDLAYPHPLSKTVDHLQPLARGGKH